PGADRTPTRRTDRAHQGPQVPVTGIVRRRGLAPLAGGRGEDRGSAHEVGEDLRVPHLRQRGARVLRRRPPAVSRACCSGWLEEGLRLVREAPPLSRRRYDRATTVRTDRSPQYGDPLRWSRAGPGQPGGRGPDARLDPPARA